MQLIRSLKQGNWPALFGYALFTGMMATGYYYNVTFVQLGLIDLGERLIGMDRRTVALDMALLAVATSLVSLAFGLSMVRRGWSQDFYFKLRLAFGVVVAQTILTAVAPALRSPGGFLAWIVVASVVLGIGVPVTFGLAVDFVPRRDRGYVAAAITAAAYFAAPVFSYPWRIEPLSRQMLAIMVAGGVGLGLIAFGRIPALESLARQHSRPEFYYGRFVRRGREGEARVSRRILGLIVLMFGVFFVDSLGFVRLANTPFLMDHAWRSPELEPRLAIAAIHVVAALIAGVLYPALSESRLFLWVFGIFALVHLLYTFPFDFGLERSGTLTEPILYAIAVSLYTVLNFAVWADLSTPATIGRNAALGVSLSAWSATFVSTAFAIVWESSGMPLEQHLRIVDALAVLFFLGLLLLAFFREEGRSGTASVG